MRPFLDLRGASGATYRFRPWPTGQSHVPIAGNYVFVREGEGGFQVVALGVADDLSRVRAEPPKGVEAGAQVYTRFNVARSVRETEHADLVAHYPSARTEDAGR